MIPDRREVDAVTALNQRRAADPEASAWVSANAGAGKTKVLTDRVLRLLLAGVSPGRLLCLTFTKAAAATMMIRVMDQLGLWVTLDNPALSEKLQGLTGDRPDQDTLWRARQLFARAVETPGGLKIETLHAFCERVLHMVPFEAGVPARFAVLDEAQSAELVAEATARVFAAAAADETGPLRRALDLVSIDAVGDNLARVIEAALKQRAFLALGLEAGVERLRRALDLDPGETADAIERAMLEDGIPQPEWTVLADTLAAGQKSDGTRAEGLRAALAASDAETRLAQYLSVFFSQKGEPLADSSVGTKSIAPDIKARLLAERDRLWTLELRRRGARALERSAALFTLAAAIHERVEAAKAARGALDFDDLIAKTLNLLRRGEAAWVLYKLDAGIDHMLLDEAQDTNPDQWEILRLLAEEFTAGLSARAGRVRTFFAVGDPKQSIYGFQGAEPRKFEESRQDWRKKTLAADQRFEDVKLTLSFRSAAAVLDAVDNTFAIAAHYAGLSFEDKAIGTVHRSARPDARGVVQLWPLVTPDKKTDEGPEAWRQPVDQLSASAPSAVVAGNIARAVRAWTTMGDENGRVWRAGDVLILVRKRGPAFEAVIRELKRLGVSVAGADRLDISAHIAVLDLVAAGRAALLPEDDLTLATALKSPLVGFDDDDFVRIAAGRPANEPLAAALAREAAAGDAAAARGMAALAEWRRLAQAHGPFGFYATLLGPGGARRRLVARLGGEAADALDVFLTHAHTSELTETPSLGAFLDRFVSAPHQFKRELDETLDEVRVMTVHGAKGLEAPLVVVLEGCDDRSNDPPLMPLGTETKGETLPVWSPGANHDSPPMQDARKKFRERAGEERNRLLYVAMTRAADRLVIAPYRTKSDKEAENAWYAMIRRGLSEASREAGKSPSPFGEGEIDTWRDEPGPSPVPAQPPRDVALLPMPEWLLSPAPPEPEPRPPLRPSSALAVTEGSRRVEGPSRPEARLRGILIHALLERLPGLGREHREKAARAFVQARASREEAAWREAVVADALGVLHSVELSRLFGPGSRAEAAITGRVRAGGREEMVSGQIDRLAVHDDEVLIADFKTGSRPPGPDEPTPEAFVAQLALYRALLAEIYPDRPVRAFVIWTAGPLAREIPADALDGALALIEAA